MLRLRSCVSTCLRSSPATSPVPPLHRLLSAATAAPTASPNPGFAPVNYLVGTCGLTPAQALKASTKLSHLKSSTNPDAVFAFLAGVGLSSVDVAAAVAKDPRLLCASMEKILAPNVAGLTGLGLGLSHTEIACLVSVVPSSFRRQSIVSNLHYYLLLYGSYENVLPPIKRCSSLLMSSLETVVKPNVAFLRECGLDACDITKMCITVPRILGTKPEQVRAMAMRVEALGVPRGSGMFRQAMRTVAFLSEEKIAAQLEFLKSTLRWSDAEVGIAVSRYPLLLRRSKATLQSKSDFLISEVGLELAYIAHRPAMLCYSLEGRLRPRYYVLKLLALLDHNRDYYAAVVVNEKVFLTKYIYPHKEVLPHLAEDYAEACRGKVLTSFTST